MTKAFKTMYIDVHVLLEVLAGTAIQICTVLLAHI